MSWGRAVSPACDFACRDRRQRPDQRSSPFRATAARFVVIDRIGPDRRGGQFVSLVGPSGCGKSTLLNIIAGIEQCDGGSVTVSAKAERASREPRIAYVFQSPRLLNWLTVEDNLNFVLEAQHVPRQEWQPRVAKYLDMVGLGGQQKNYPLDLSGGMQQPRRHREGAGDRAGHPPDGRAVQPSRRDHRAEASLRPDGDSGAGQAETILFVTHDLGEAVFLSDRISMMSTKPARIFKEVPVDFPRPRTLEDEAILDLRHWCAEFFSVVEVKS